MADRLIATNVTRGKNLVVGGRVADSMVSRVIGLLRDKALAEGDGLWIVPCNSIHSFAMKFSFDAVFLSRDLKVVHLISEMKPWRMSPMKLAAHSVLEIPAGVIARSTTGIGDQFAMQRD